jgi:hypothetical protein
MCWSGSAAQQIKFTKNHPLAFVFIACTAINKKARKSDHLTGLAG